MLPHGHADADLEVSGGPTHFAPAHGTELTDYDPVAAPFNPPNQPQQAGRSPELLQRLYSEERPVKYRRGTAALYRLDSWHRGTMPAPDQVRIGHHMIFRTQEAEWIRWQAYPTTMSSMPGRFLEGLSPEQRTVFGFPAVGNPYWTAHTVDLSLIHI